MISTPTANLRIDLSRAVRTGSAGASARLQQIAQVTQCHDDGHDPLQMRLQMVTYH